MRLVKEQSIGLIIDMQERLLPHICNHEEMLARIAILVKGMRILTVPVLVTQQYTKGLGNTVPELTRLFDPFAYIEKIAFSCCREPSFQLHLHEFPARMVIIAGIESHVCVLQTVVDLLDEGYQPVVIEDCISSRRLADKHVSVDRMRQEGALISTSESILFELTGLAGTEQFKAISNLVK
jgi:nicotinamidase-related amidase